MSELPPPPGPPPGPPPPPPSGPPPSGPPPGGPLGPPPTSPPPGWAPPSTPPPPSRGKPLAIALGVVGAVLVLGLAVLVPLVLSQRDDASPSATQDGEVDTTLDAVEVYEDLPTTHTDEPQDYEQSPPVGGEHAPVWLDCGVYDAPVPDENLVHDLEHGTVFIAYEPGLDQDAVDALAAVLPQNGILAPYDGLSAPVVVTVWERQLALTGADDPRLALFLDAFGAGETAPEPFASCAGGIRPDGTGVTT